MLLQAETLSPFKRRVDHFSQALNSNLIGSHFCLGPMSFNLVNLICLGQWGTGEIIMLPKHAVAEINHPKILTWHAVATAAILVSLWVFLLSCEADWRAILAWSCSALTSLLCSLEQAKVNNGKEIEWVTLQMESVLKSSLSSSTVIYSLSSKSVQTQSVIVAISVWAGGYSYFCCSHLPQRSQLMDTYL